MAFNENSSAPWRPTGFGLLAAIGLLIATAAPLTALSQSQVAPDPDPVKLSDGADKETQLQIDSDTELAAELRSAMEAGLQSELDNRMRSELESELGEKLEAQRKADLSVEPQPKLKLELRVELDFQTHAPPDGLHENSGDRTSEPATDQDAADEP